ncbi:cell division protein FtsX [Paenibacillus selenitireducens]|jgi:cell division transport system permease protein|uniref:Cell division protein FtsX n=1 Tax=Paenibacillus selenitireducens TaxID=1324314 RepID=A0A1T2X893_9BACL|nr:permease-like cell division protein FtsX [Paenibacillus selenitireducens]OPA76108.1 cell division protein FtsX [Paenibacillus selenitireducens]
MTFRTIIRHFREGFKNVLRNGWMSFASVSSIVISLFILGVFLLLSLNINALAGQVESQVQIQVYLEPNTTVEQRDQLNTQIGNMPEVSKVQVVTKEEGMKLFRENLGDDGKELLSGYTEDTNPLPDTLVVDVVEPTTIPDVAKKIEALKQTTTDKVISKVKYGEGTVEKMFKVTNTIRNGGLIVVAGLAITSMFLISNTIKVTIFARRREISIMKLVGATNHFIRWPFFIEGAVIGLLGSGVTIGLLFAGYDRLVKLTQVELGLMLIKLVPLPEIYLSVGGVILGLGVMIGVWGSTVSIRKFLKV